mgnify:CR=1 FL=1
MFKLFKIKFLFEIILLKNIKPIEKMLLNIGKKSF